MKEQELKKYAGNTFTELLRSYARDRYDRDNTFVRPEPTKAAADDKKA